MLSLGNKLTLNSGKPIYKFVNKYSIDFDGVDDCIVTDGADTVAQPTTYSMWIKSDVTSDNYILGHGHSFYGSFALNQSNKPLLWLDGSYYRYWNDVPQQDDGEWHHWVVYADTNDINNSKLYCDGVLQTVNSTTASSSTFAYSESLTIGGTKASGGNYFEGKIDEFAVFDRELTQEEITRMYNTYYSPNRVANGNFSQIGNEEVTNGDFSQEGSEEVINGDFATDSDWVLTSGATISNNKLNINTTAYDFFAIQNNVVDDGKIYKVNFDATISSGSGIIVYLYNAPSNATITSSGNYTFYFTAAGTGIRFRASDTALVGSIDNVSVKEVGQDWTFSTGWSMGDNKVVVSSATQSTAINQTNVLQSNKAYKITYEILDYVEGGVRILLGSGGSTTGSTNSSNGVFTEYLINTSTGGTDELYLSAMGSSTTLSIDNISIKEVGQHWTFGTGTTIENGVANITAASSGGSALSQTGGVFVSGKNFKVTFTISNYSSGSIAVSNITPTTYRNANGTYTLDAVGAGGDFLLFSSGFVGSIDNIVVQELKHDATNLMLNAGAYQSANPLITSTKSMEFDGTDDYLIVNSVLGSFTGSFSFWVNRDDNTGHQYLYDARGTGNTGTGYAYVSNGTDNISVSSGTVYVDGVASIVVPTDGNWHNIVITGITLNVTEDIRFGSTYALTNEFNGKMTEVGNWDRTLTALEVASLYNQGMPTNLLVNRNNYQSGNPTVFNTKQVDFDGTDDYMNAGVLPDVFRNAFTVSAWVWTDTSSGAHQIISTGQGAFSQIFQNGSTLIIQVRGSSTITKYVANYFDSAHRNKWVYLTIVYNGSTIKAYRNGVEVFSDSLSGTLNSTTDSLQIGRYISNVEFWNGKMSQIGLFSSALTADEVSSLYNHGLPIDLTTNQAAYESSSNLVGYWRMGSGLYDNYPSIGQITSGVIADQTNATLSSELIVNGDFATDSGWSKNTGWTISGGKANRDGSGGANSDIQQSVSVTAGKVYKISYDRTYISGGGETNLYSDFYTDGSNTTIGRYIDTTQETVTITAYFSPNYTGTLPVRVWGIGTFTGTVDNVSLKEFGGNPAIMTNMISNDIENGSPYANVVQNSDFSEGTTDWAAFQGGLSVNNGIALVTATANNDTRFRTTASMSTVVGKTYLATAELKTMSGTKVGIANNDGTSFTYSGSVQELTSTGSFSYTFTATNTNTGLVFKMFDANTGQSFSIDNVTLTEVNTGLQGYWKMGDGTNDEYPVIYDQVDPTLGSDISVWAGEDANVGNYANIETNTTTALVVGKMYKVAFTVSNYTSGSFKFRQPSGLDLGATGTANGNYVQYGIATNTAELDCDAFNLGFVGTIGNYSVQEVQGNPATMTNMVEGNITNQYPLTKIRNYYRMGDGILDGYPIIQDQTSPNLAHIPTTNLVTSSEDFTSGWSADDVTITTNAITSPDGTLTADKIIGNTVSSRHNILDSGLTNSVTASISVFAKAGELRYLQVASANTGNQYANFDLLTGTIGNIGSDFSSVKIIPLANDWYRITLTSLGQYNNLYLSLVSGLTAAWLESWTMSNNTDGLYVWGAQLEEQSQATAYLKSDGIAAVRKSSTTNLITYSEDFSQSSWSSPSSMTLTPNDSISPNGLLNATKLNFTNPSSTNALSFNYTTIAVTYSSSIFVKYIDAQFIQLWFGSTGFGGGHVNFDLINGLKNDLSGAIGSITDVGNGWFKISATKTSTGGATDVFAIATVGSLNSTRFGDEVDGSVYIWGSQVEEQTQAETYAKTTGLPVTIDLFTENNYGTMTNMSASDIVEDTPNN